MREADIEAGADRSAIELRDDLTTTCQRLEDAWRNLDDDRWTGTVVVTPGARPVRELVFRRLREVEVHHVDLDLGYTTSSWPPFYVEGELTRRLEKLGFWAVAPLPISGPGSDSALRYTCALYTASDTSERHSEHRLRSSRRAPERHSGVSTEVPLLRRTASPLQRGGSVELADTSRSPRVA
jgi:uncharacterized protein (TIGR03083 family)